MKFFFQMLVTLVCSLVVGVEGTDDFLTYQKLKTMETSMKIQMDIKNNAQDLQNYMLDLASWEEEMKKKEVAVSKEVPCEQLQNIPPPRNKIKRTKSNNDKNGSTKPKKISAYDYSAWDKFDADKACDAVDENDQCNKIETIEETEESKDSSEEESNDKSAEKMSLIDEAFYQKELGNNFVKKEQWNEAIKCYTSAINLDSENPIFYANRSLCFLKLKNFKSAETDATVAIQLDKNYVKAYQRRAFARLALGQLAEAKSDFEEVLKIEPKNALARMEVDKIEKKLKKDSESIKTVPEKKTFNHKDIFKSKESSSKTPSVTTTKTDQIKTNKSVKAVKKVAKETSKSVSAVPENKEKNLECDDGGDGDKQSSSQSSTEESKVFKPLPDWCKIVQPIKKAPHQRSKKPLRKVDIIQVSEVGDTDDPTSKTITLPKTECKKEEKCVPISLSEEDISQIERLSLDVPKTAIQFQNCWKVIKRNPEKAYSYLKQIPRNSLNQIFENSLESDVFSDLINFLASDELKKDPELIYSFLVDLSNVKRFTSLVLFMSEVDKTCLKQCISVIKATKTEEEISTLHRLYEL